MNTSQLVEKISKKCLNFTSKADILSRINDAQNELLNIDCVLMRVSPDPFLSTTDGVYEYDLNPIYRRVKQVYIRDPNIIEYNGQNKWPFPLNEMEEDKLKNRLWKVPTYSKPSPSFGTSVRITFDEEMNPQTYTDQYRMIAYTWPEQLTSTAIPLTIPSHHASRVLLARVMQDIDEERFGRSDNWDRKLEAYKNDLYSDLNRVDNVDSASIPGWFS